MTLIVIPPEPCAEDILDILKAAADIGDPGYGRWAYETWERLSILYFESTLEPGPISWNLTPHGRSLGYYEFWRNAITLHTSLLAPRSMDPWGIGKLLGERFTTDVLLHEMMHQAIFQVGNYPEKDSKKIDSHNCDPWCDHINRLIPLLRIDTELVAKPIRQRRVKAKEQTKGKGKVTWVTEEGCMTRQQLAGFPHTLRTLDYYSGEKIELLRQKVIG